MLGLIKVNGNCFVSVILDTLSVFPETFSKCTTGLANILTWESGIIFMQCLQLIKYMSLSEEQDKLCGILHCSPVL